MGWLSRTRSSASRQWLLRGAVVRSSRTAARLRITAAKRRHRFVVSDAHAGFGRRAHALSDGMHFRMHHAFGRRPVGHQYRARDARSRQVRAQDCPASKLALVALQLQATLQSLHRIAGSLSQ